MTKWSYVWGWIWHDPVARWSGPLSPIAALLPLLGAPAWVALLLVVVSAMTTVLRLADVTFEQIKPRVSVHFLPDHPFIITDTFAKAARDRQRYFRLLIRNETLRAIEDVEVVFQETPSFPTVPGLLHPLVPLAIGDTKAPRGNLASKGELWAWIFHESWPDAYPEQRLLHPMYANYGAKTPLTISGGDSETQRYLLQIRGKDFHPEQVYVQITLPKGGGAADIRMEPVHRTLAIPRT
jgi:hypothetical protein